MALNETLSEGGNIRDGMAITRKMWNRDFHGMNLKTKNTLSFILKAKFYLFEYHSFIVILEHTLRVATFIFLGLFTFILSLVSKKNNLV